MVHGCPQGKSDNRPDPLTLLFGGVEISQGYHTISRTHYSERSTTRIDRVMVILYYIGSPEPHSPWLTTLIAVGELQEA